MIKLLHGTLQHYIWGGKEYLANWLNLPKPHNQVCAEVWFGDHPNAPSVIVEETGKTPLNQWLGSHMDDVISRESQARYGNRLPFLLKILDVRAPLSIQLHPDKAQAQAGFAREQAAGLKVGDPKKLYVDDNHKPEMMIALSDFWLLHGFAGAEKSRALLSSRPSLAPVLAWLDSEGVETTYAKVLRSSPETISGWLAPILAQAQIDGDTDNPDYWVRDTVCLMDMDPKRLDPGLVSFYLLNIVAMKTGEAIEQLARLPHAYLRGQNIEIMAASDNVLRAGLTPKTVAVDELLKIVDTHTVVPKIMPPAPAAGWHSFPAQVDDFTLDTLYLAAWAEEGLSAKEATIILVMNGEITVRENDQEITVPRGQAVLLSAGACVQLQAKELSYLIFASSKS